MDINTLIDMILYPVIKFILSTVKNPLSVAKLKKSLPVINQAISGLTQLRDAIAAGNMTHFAFRKPKASTK